MQKNAVRTSVGSKVFDVVIYVVLILVGLLCLLPFLHVAAMSLSSFCVVMNALRLNLVGLHKASAFKRHIAWKAAPLMEDPQIVAQTDEGKNARLDLDQEENIMEDKQMERNITVNGMMCPNCERHVKEALEKVEGVAQATSNHQTNSVALVLDGEVSEEALKNAVTEAGYEYIG